jgi:uncharacterized repeat protein (TIGR01451 family)
LNARARARWAKAGLFLGLALRIALAAPAAAQTEILLEKATNGQDADLPPGPVLLVGAPVTWTYVVTNIGSRDLTNVAVTDDQGVSVSCPATALGPGESMVCTGNGTAEAGQYGNVGTASAELQDATPVSDTDPSHYFGQDQPAIDLEKATNGFDADAAPGPYLPVGSAVTWTYEVTNVGSEPLSEIEVTDDQGVTVICPATTLAVGESMTCTANGTVQPGPYANIGTVTAITPDESPAGDSDPSHHFGQLLLLEKATNGQDADVPPGPSLNVGDPVAWTYTVTNPGPATVTGVAVTDDQGVTVTCPSTTLAAGESVICTGAGTAQLGQYVNVGTATALLPAGGQLSASDPSHYAGGLLGLQKSTNGVDADLPPGPTVLVGSAVAWTYEVTNFSGEAMTDVAVTDDQGVTVTCPGTTLGAGESMTCTADGTAQAGQYANVGMAEGTISLGLLTASDPSHYFGEVPSPPALAAAKTATLLVDQDADGQADPGDTLGYTILLTNGGQSSATGVTFADTPDPNTALTAGSVTTTQGTVTFGNTPGDTTVAVDVGTLAGSGTVTITFQVTIDDPLAPGVTEVSNQGLVSAAGLADVPTDDPAQPGGTDATVVPVAAPPPPSVLEIPTLGEWGLLALALLLGALGLRRVTAG